MKGAFVVNDEKPDEVKTIRGLEDKKINAIYFKEGLIWAETYEHEIFVLKPSNPTEAVPIPELNGINIWSITRDKYGNYIVGSNKGAFYVLYGEAFQAAYQIPNTKDQGTTSIMVLCDEVWIGSLSGYQVFNLTSLQKVLSIN